MKLVSFALIFITFLYFAQAAVPENCGVTCHPCASCCDGSLSLATSSCMANLGRSTLWNPYGAECSIGIKHPSDSSCNPAIQCCNKYYADCIDWGLLGITCGNPYYHLTCPGQGDIPVDFNYTDGSGTVSLQGRWLIAPHCGAGGSVGKPCTNQNTLAASSLSVAYTNTPCDPDNIGRLFFKSCTGDSSNPYTVQMNCETEGTWSKFNLKKLLKQKCSETPSTRFLTDKLTLFGLYLKERSNCLVITANGYSCPWNNSINTYGEISGSGRYLGCNGNHPYFKLVKALWRTYTILRGLSGYCSSSGGLQAKVYESVNFPLTIADLNENSYWHDEWYDMTHGYVACATTSGCNQQFYLSEINAARDKFLELYTVGSTNSNGDKVFETRDGCDVTILDDENQYITVVNSASIARYNTKAFGYMTLDQSIADFWTNNVIPKCIEKIKNHCNGSSTDNLQPDLDTFGSSSSGNAAWSYKGTYLVLWNETLGLCGAPYSIVDTHISPLKSSYQTFWNTILRETCHPKKPLSQEILDHLSKTFWRNSFEVAWTQVTSVQNTVNCLANYDMTAKKNALIAQYISIEQKLMSKAIKICQNYYPLNDFDFAMFRQQLEGRPIRNFDFGERTLNQATPVDVVIRNFTIDYFGRFNTYLTSTCGYGSAGINSTWASMMTAIANQIKSTFITRQQYCFKYPSGIDLPNENFFPLTVDSDMAYLGLSSTPSDYSYFMNSTLEVIESYIKTSCGAPMTADFLVGTKSALNGVLLEGRTWARIKQQCFLGVRQYASSSVATQNVMEEEEFEY